MAVVVAVLALALVTGIHEAGHWLAVRAKGGRVRMVQVGRGPALLRWRRGPGEVVVSALPLGGRIHYDDIPPGTGQAVVALAGVAANLLAAILAFALAVPLADAAGTAGAWFWAVPGAIGELLATGSAGTLRSGVRDLVGMVAASPVVSLPYLVGALSALWAALNLVPLPVVETDGWHVARALWTGVRRP